MAEDYYKILGVSRTATPEEIQRRFVRSRKYHPDLHPDDKKAKEKFQQAQQAFETLNDEKKRKMYDQFGSDYEKFGAGGGPYPGVAAGSYPGGGQSWGGQMPEGMDGIDLGQIFGGMGGGGGGGFGNIFEQLRGGRGGGGRAKKAKTPPPAGADVQESITVPFNTAIQGGKIDLQIARAGKSPETLSVKIPAGIADGGRIRLRGQGEPSPRGGIAGDLFLVVHIVPHHFFTRVGDHLEIKVPVTLSEALLGAKIDVPSPQGTISIKVPAGTSSGKRLRIKEHGIPRSDGTRGDLYAVIQIMLPEQPSEELLTAVKEIPANSTIRNDLHW